MYADLSITHPPDERSKKLLRKMADRGEELRAKNISRPNFGFPSFRLMNGRVNTADIGRDFSNDWDAAIKQLKPFLNKSGDLFGPDLIEMVAGFKQHPESLGIEAILKRYYLLQANAQHMDALLYRCRDIEFMAIDLRQGRFEASNQAGAFLMTIFADGMDADPVHMKRVQDYASRDGASALEFDSVGQFGICRLMNDKFCREWLQKYEMHDDIPDEEFFMPYLSPRKAKWDVRHHLFPGLKTRYLVLNWLCQMAAKVLEEHP